MSEAVGRLRRWSSGGSEGVHFWCPGCKDMHSIRTAGQGAAWTFDGNYQSPTFSPSVLVTYDGADCGTESAPPERCHSFVRCGLIQFLGDCTHALAGQTVELPTIG